MWAMGKAKIPLLLRVKTQRWQEPLQGFQEIGSSVPFSIEQYVKNKMSG
jgi:hypothetical protein